MSRLIVILLLLLLTGCDSEDPFGEEKNKLHQKGEYIHDAAPHTTPPQIALTPPDYPWKSGTGANFAKITKEFFRCKGCPLNPQRVITQGGALVKQGDCAGAASHSLPLHEGKEFIYPILIDILNYVQKKTDKPVVITCGHQCPTHRQYAKAEGEKLPSKHMNGTEVDFYVAGLENQPQKIIDILMAYYEENSKYKGKKEYLEFTRYTKGDINIKTQPWMNQEIFIKLYTPSEGRNFDNRHPFSYISIQVRYDMEKNQKVNFSWDEAEKNFKKG